LKAPKGIKEVARLVRDKSIVEEIYRQKQNEYLFAVYDGKRVRYKESIMINGVLYVPLNLFWQFTKHHPPLSTIASIWSIVGFAITEAIGGQTPAPTSKAQSIFSFLLFFCSFFGVPIQC
jgi:hypothetical protein